MRGRFITIEGIDGAGGETQSKALVAYLKKKGIKAVRLSYPDSSGLIGKLIYTWLSSSYELKPNILFLLYASDMLKDAEKIKRYVKSGYWVIADRWFGSTLAYQGTEIGLDRALQFARIFDIPKPDVNILLRISPEESMRRKKKEKNELDRHEKDRAFLKKVSTAYNMLAKKAIFGKWVVIDGEKGIADVSAEIKKALKI